METDPAQENVYSSEGNEFESIDDQSAGKGKLSNNSQENFENECSEFVFIQNTCLWVFSKCAFGEGNVHLVKESDLKFWEWITLCTHKTLLKTSCHKQSYIYRNRPVTINQLKTTSLQTLQIHNYKKI